MSWVWSIKCWSQKSIARSNIMPHKHLAKLGSCEMWEALSLLQLAKLPWKTYVVCKPLAGTWMGLLNAMRSICLIGSYHQTKDDRNRRAAIITGGNVTQYRVWRGTLLCNIKSFWSPCKFADPKWTRRNPAPRTTLMDCKHWVQIHRTIRVLS